MIRHLTENLPFMPAPSWVGNLVEPIAVRDVLHYLRGAARVPASVSGRFDIGSREVLTYAALMHGYRHEAGLGRRRIYAFPVPAPRLAGWWVALAEAPDLVIFEGLRDSAGALVALCVGRIAPESLPTRERYEIVGEGTLRQRAAAGEPIRAVAMSGHLRLCVRQAEAAR